MLGGITNDFTFRLPVANLFTISEAGSTSEMSKGCLANLICSCPRSVQERTYKRKLTK